ncbi:MAG TPA: TlpA disulfide reductase family protein [Candidatus Polarisedimenticolia bacterium]|nr:TlpA disulfide reductase family protein [Candidatus Polarisedimenticolia bacterium]
MMIRSTLFPTSLLVTGLALAGAGAPATPATTPASKPAAAAKPAPSTPAAPVTGLQLIPAEGADVLKAVKAPGARAVIVNLWASWCPPCREEFPDIIKVGRELKGRGVRLVLVSGDFDAGHEDALKFLKEHGVDFPTYVRTGSDQEFIDGFAPEWSGILPTTLIYDGTGKMRHLHEGTVTYKQLKDLVLEVVNSPGARSGKESGS